MKNQTNLVSDIAKEHNIQHFFPWMMRFAVFKLSISHGKGKIITRWAEFVETEK